ncbi:charged multivesicular body protein 6 [Daktulosphaira vitifoliae]|uniref:charged multivesicular body protein 6 n=1 Tax=Daktulosphaira vitifoliae TaxID=58002 RepID=UPI0021A9FB03|nr:charged multivesicular body protein 6 [Daktulosphaira vitifoliae]
MGIFFGKPKTSRITDYDRAVLQMKQQRDTLKRYQLRVELLLDKEKELAKKLIKENKKEKAKLLLRKKKYQTEQLERTEAALDTVEKLIQDLEYTQIESKVIESLKIGNNALKKANELLNVEEIEQLLDETRDGIEKQKEITDLLSGALSIEEEIAVETELEELISLEHQKIIDKLPDVPSNHLPTIVTDTKVEEKESPKRKIAVEI